MTVSAILTAALLVGANPYQEASALALKDSRRYSAEYASQVRYCLLLGHSVEERRQQWAAVSFSLNSVSRVRRITVPAVIDPDYRVVRWAIVDYSGRDSKSYNEWLRATAKLLDPSFVVVAETGKKQLVAAGSWAGSDYAALQLHCGTGAPLVRADYLVAKLTGDPATYYEFAGIAPNEGDFLTSLGVDRATIEKLRAQTQANIRVSKVTGKPRRIVHEPSPLGSVWITLDVAAEAVEKNPLRVPVDFAATQFKFDASEIFFTRPNNLWGTALYDAAGKRQNAVPGAIATDRYGLTGRGEIVPLYSCLRCHTREGFSGLQDFADAQVSIPTASYDKRAAEQIQELYDPERMTGELTHGALLNVKAIARATANMVIEGDQSRAMTPAEATNALVSTVEGYFAPVTLRTVAREFDCIEGVALGLVQGSSDPAAIGLATGDIVTRADYEVGFPSIAVNAK